MSKLLEVRRNELISKSTSSAKGKERFNKRNKSHIQNTVKAMNSIDMNKLFKDGILTVNLPIHGETNDYTVKITFGGFIDLLRDQIKHKSTVDFRDISRAVINGFNQDDVYIHCSCPDFCLHEDTLIKLLNGEVYKIKDIHTKFKQNEDLWCYSVDSNGDFKPGKITDVWISGYTNEFIKITLDNNKEILTTPNHKYMLRDGSFIEAKDIKINTSLMPLYFKHNIKGYEDVKVNSIYNKTVFKSVYKIVAETILAELIEEAKQRSKEDIICIHHKDFNKLNNNPSNLQPMGKLEHWEYHYKHNIESGNLDKWIKAGRKYWEQESARKKHSEFMSAYMKEYHSKFTPEERSQLHKNCPSYNQLWKDKISNSNKAAWSNYNQEEYEARCLINKNSNNNPETKKKQSEKRKQFYIEHPEHKQKCSQNIQKAINKITGIPFTEEHKRKISEGHKKRTPEQIAQSNLKRRLCVESLSTEEKERRIIKNRDSKIMNIINYMMSNNIELTFSNYKSCMKLPQYYKKSFPFIDKYFNNIEEVINYYSLQNYYNHKVKKIEKVYFDKEIPIYDISVENYNNFYVDAGVILHNCYRFNFFATRNDFNSGTPEIRPSNITNPKDTLGSACKHVLLVLNNTSWILRVSRAITNYIRYIENNYNELYRKIIEPALFSKEAIQRKYADEYKLAGEEDKEILDTANKYNQERTRFQPGNKQGVRFAPKENKNPENNENPDDIV